MSFAQFTYTSCQRGVNGQAGFQVRGVSPGLSLEDQRAIINWCYYKAPEDEHRAMENEYRAGGAPVRYPLPDEERAKIRDRFPLALRSFLLPSGRQVVLRVGYVGLDYSNRWGNMFAHALVFEPGTLSRSPIDCYEWDGWLLELPPAEDTKDAPPPLPSLPESALAFESSFSYANLADFFGGFPEAQAKLGLMLEAVRLRKRGGRALVLRSSSDIQNIYLIAALVKSFPASCQAGLSLSTYHHDPQATLDINGTLGQTRFSFSSREVNNDFYMFDFSKNVFSELTPSSSLYIARVADWLVNAPEKMEGLQSFSRFFSLSDLEGDLDSLMELYGLTNGEAEPTAERLSAILSGLGTRVNGAQREALLTLLQAPFEAFVARHPQSLSAILEFVVPLAEASQKPALHLLPYRLWLECFLRFLPSTGHWPEALLVQHDALLRRFPADKSEFADLFLSSLHALLEKSPELAIDDEKSIQVLALLGRHYGALSVKTPWLEEDYQLIYLGMVKGAFASGSPAVARFLAINGRDSRILGQMADLVAAGISSWYRNEERLSAFAVLGQALGSCLGPLSDKERGEFFSRLQTPDVWPLLAGDFRYGLEQSAKPFVFYRDYEQNVLAALASQKGQQTWRERFRDVFVQHIAARPEAALSLAFSQSQEGSLLASFTKKQKQQLLDGAVSALNLGDSSSESLAKSFSVLAQDNGLRDPSARFMKLRSLLRQQRSPGGFQAPDFQSLRSLLCEADPPLPKAQYELLCWELLVPNLRRAVDQRAFEDWVEIFYSEPLAETLLNAVRASYVQPGMGYGTTVSMGGILFAISAKHSPRLGSPTFVQTLGQIAREALAQHIHNWSARQREALRRQLPVTEQAAWDRLSGLYGGAATGEGEGFFEKLLRRLGLRR